MSDFSAPGAETEDPGRLMQRGLQAIGGQNLPEAIALFERALTVRPEWMELRYRLVDTLNNHALNLARQERFDEALPFAQRSVDVDNTDLDALNIAGYLLTTLNRNAEAIDAYERAVQLDQRSAELWFNLAVCYVAMSRQEEAEAAYARVIALVPDHFMAIVNRGVALARLWRWTDAIACFEKALSMRPGDVHLKMGLLVNRIFLCDWRDRDVLLRDVIAACRNDQLITEPFESLALFDDPALHRLVAEKATNLVTSGLRPPPRRHTPTDGKIRVGYLSADLHNHATTYLMAEVFERHDRDRFETVAFSVGPVVEDTMQSRMRGAFDTFHNARDLTDDQLADLIASERIEILVDLKGHTGNGRLGSLVTRPAPIQVNYLGYPGTTGADFIDYIIGDPVIMPPGCDPFYSEKVVRLPRTYQPNSERPSGAAQTRAMHGLPEEGVIFCSFNGAYKITPEVFSSWMRILTAVPGSVLWLLVMKKGEDMQSNLRREARARGVDPDRLVFADFALLPDHLARLELADIVLDTTPCNAHTTASDALWVGRPVITCAGPTFAGRVAASLVTAAGAPELNRPSWEDYEAFAIELGRDPAAIEAWKEKLLALKKTSPLFDVEMFTRDLEATYITMSKRWRAGEAPVAFDA